MEPLIDQRRLGGMRNDDAKIRRLEGQVAALRADLNDALSRIAVLEARKPTLGLPKGKDAA